MRVAEARTHRSRPGKVAMFRTPLGIPRPRTRTVHHLEKWTNNSPYQTPSFPREAHRAVPKNTQAKSTYNANDIQLMANSIVKQMNTKSSLRYTVSVPTKFGINMEFKFEKHTDRNQYDFALRAIDQYGIPHSSHRTTLQHHQIYDYGAEAPFYAWLNLSIEKVLINQGLKKSSN